MQQRKHDARRRKLKEQKELRMQQRELKRKAVREVMDERLRQLAEVSARRAFLTSHMPRN